MIELPPALTPWAAQLAIFPAEIALCLGQAAARLCSLLGPWPQRHQRLGDPDGYDGVARRGSYQRLLPAEWLLLEELPDEFLRRVVSHEHAFLAPAFRQRAGGRHCVALFDAGPEQLGAPRIAQLALLIALAQRAAAAGATFEWAALRPGPLSWSAEVSKLSVSELMRSRCARPLSADELALHLKDAEDRVRAAGAGCELWGTGGEAVTAAISSATGGRAGVLTVRDALEPGPPRRVQITAGVAARDFLRTQVLELPAERLAVQLLRDPFALQVAPLRRAGEAMDGRSNLLFSVDDRRVFCRGAGESLLTVSVPNSSRGHTGPPIAYQPPEGQRVIAIGRASGNRAMVLCEDDDGLTAHQLSKRGATSNEQHRFRYADGELPAQCSRALRPLALLGDDRMFFADDRGDLFELAQGLARRVDHHVQDLRAGASSMCWLTHHLGELAWNLYRGHSPQPFAASERRVLWRDGVEQARVTHSRLPMLAYRTAGQWTLYCEPHPASQPVLPPDVTVHGILGLYQEEPWLLALDAERRRLLAVRDGATAVLCTSAVPITAVDVSHRGWSVAYLTEQGHPSVYSFHERKFLLRAPGSALA